MKARGDLLAIERGLQDARSMAPGSGMFELGLEGAFRDGNGHLLGTLDAKAHLVGTDAFDLAAFARAQGGVVNTGHGWEPEAAGFLGISGSWR